MSSFDLLHPALQHHIVNSLGWRELRPFQEEVIPPLLDGKHAIVLAPTAGGKTEAAFFPLVSRMLAEDWRGLSILYLCPIKALLNNLESRLQRYCSLLGRRAALWHGDVKTYERKRLLREPPDCLLTTPESLEAMLVSTNVDAKAFFGQLQAVVVDEVHSFAGDDRGWHLLAVLERVTRMAGRELQRIGLSATVGNPDDLLSWLAGQCTGSRFVYRPANSQEQMADVKLDYVGSLHNAAVVISRLHRGEKRLVFVDSRARAEELGLELRRLDVASFVTHSSLSPEQRHQAEEAFASRDNCVIVATSALELGIDIGDLDRVIQIDAPGSVASFLQRMGRTGRRADTDRNCLFLSTGETALLQASALIELWAQGFIESVSPPPSPFHILAQQLMALALQERGIGRHDWEKWIERVPGFASMPATEVESLVQWMLDQEILFDDNGILWFGRQGEEEFSRRNYMALLSVFTSAPLFAVLHGRRELGFVDALTFMSKQESPRVILLGGRAWQVNHLDWTRRVAHVQATDARGKSQWKGLGQGLGFELCQAIRDVLVSQETPDYLSNRAAEQMTEVRLGFPWVEPGSTAVVRQATGKLEWWTFGGARVNASLAGGLAHAVGAPAAVQDLALTFEDGVTVEALADAIEDLRSGDTRDMRPIIDDRALDGLKFTSCVPKKLATRMLADRVIDAAGAQRVLAEPVRVTSEP